MIKIQKPAVEYKAPIVAAEKAETAPRVVEIPKKLCVKPVTTSARPKRIIKGAMIEIVSGLLLLFFNIKFYLPTFIFNIHSKLFPVQYTSPSWAALYLMFNLYP
jgi:hypothetical protein